MIKIIYISFLFNSHWCAGVMQFKDNTITYWKDGKYATEEIVKTNVINKSESVLKTESGVIILFKKGRAEYFVGNKKTVMHFK